MFLFYFVRNPFVLPAIYIYIKILAEGPGVARGKKQNKKNKKNVEKKNFSPFGPAVWPAIRNIFVYECLVLLYR